MGDDPPDDALVAATLAGDRTAFGVLVARHGALVRYVVGRHFPRGDAAIDHEDLCQDVWVRAYTRLSSYVPGRRFGAWLGAVAGYYCIDRGRRRHLATTPLDTALRRGTTGPGPEEEALRGELGDTLAAALGHLTAHQRGTVVLCCGQGLDNAGAGALLGLPVTTIKMRRWTGRRRLRTLLAAELRT